MIKLKVVLKAKKSTSLDTDYKSELNEICEYFINERSSIYVNWYANNHKPKKKCRVKDNIKFSPFICEEEEIRVGKVLSKGDIVNWYINSHSYEIILKLVQGLFKSNALKVKSSEFEVLSIEAYHEVGALKESIQN